MKRLVCILLGMILLLMAGCQQETPVTPTDPTMPEIPVIENPSISLTTCYNGETVDICCEDLRAYLNAQTEAEQIELLQELSGYDMSYQVMKFDWEPDDSTTYTVFFADNPNFESPVTVETGNTYLEDFGFFVPGVTYYWKVEGDLQGSTSVIDYFTVTPEPVRFIGTESIMNVRDIGGWSTDDGHTVRYGLIYRCGKTNPGGSNTCSETDVALFRETLGVVTEIDLRGSDAYGQTMSVFGEDIGYVKAPISGYSAIFPQFSQSEPVAVYYDARSTESIQEIFAVLGREESYPLVFHCNAGADRTGTLAFLINGLLGVSLEDLTRDYELTSFGGHTRWRSDITADNTFADYGIMLEESSNYIAFNQMYQVLMENYATADGTLASAIENYLVNACHVDQQDIDAVKKIMLK